MSVVAHGSLVLKLATNGQTDKPFLLTPGFCPQRVVCPCPGSIYMWKNIKKMCIKSEFKEIILKLAPGIYTCIRSLKMCIKSDSEEIILKLATYGQREKAFLMSLKFCPQGVVCPCPGAIHMYKSIKIYTRTRCQMSVYRTTGPLVLVSHSRYFDKNFTEMFLVHKVVSLISTF